MSDISITEQSTTIELTISSTEVMVSEQGAVTLHLTEIPLTLDITEPTPYEIDLTQDVYQTIEIIREGPRGPQGLSGTSTQGVASEPISALRIVRAINATEIALADSTGTFAEARCLGISTSAGSIGTIIDVTFFGAVEDASFTYAAGEPLFLTQDGFISNTQDPLSVYNSTIGHGLGAGAIFIDLQEPIEL